MRKKRRDSAGSADDADDSIIFEALNHRRCLSPPPHTHNHPHHHHHFPSFSSARHHFLHCPRTSTNILGATFFSLLHLLASPSASYLFRPGYHLRRLLLSPLLLLFSAIFSFPCFALFFHSPYSSYFSSSITSSSSPFQLSPFFFSSACFLFAGTTSSSLRVAAAEPISQGKRESGQWITT